MRKILSVLLAVLMVFSTVSYAAPMAFTGADSAAEIPAVEEPAEEPVVETGTLAGDTDPYFDEEFGTLVYEVNFDALSTTETYDFTGYSPMNIINQGCEINTALTSLKGDQIRYRSNVWNKYVPADGDVIDKGNGDKYISFSASESDAGNRVMWIFATTSGSNTFVSEEGNFVVTLDTLVPKESSTDNVFDFVFNHTNGAVAYEDAGKTVQKPVKGTWSKFVAEYGDDATMDGVGNSNGAVSSISEINQIKVTSTVDMGTLAYGMDNLRVYWLPKTVEITVDMSELGVDDSVFEFDTIGLSTADLVENINVPFGYTITGFSKTKGGAVISGDRLRFTQDTTLYPVYEKDANVSDYGSLVVNFDFDLLTADADYSEFADNSIDASGRTDTLKALGGTLITSADYTEGNYKTDVPFFHAYTHDTPEVSIVAKDKGNGDIYLELTALKNNPVFGIRTYSGYPLTLRDSGRIVMAVDVLSETNTAPITGADFNDTTAGDSEAGTDGKYNNSVTVCDETAVLNEWTTIGVVDTISCNANYNQFKTNLKVGEKLCIDNLSLWWVPYTADITIDNSEYYEEDYYFATVDSDYYTINELNEVFLDAGAYYEDETFVLTGVKTSKNGEVITDGLWVNHEMTLYPVWEKYISPYAGKYGELIFEVNFEDIAAGTEYASSKEMGSFVSIDTLGGIRNENVLGSNDITVGFCGQKDSDTSIVIKNDAVHGNYLEYTIGASGGNNANVLAFYCVKGGVSFIEEGSIYEDGCFIFEYDLLNNSAAADQMICFSAEGKITIESSNVTTVKPARGAWGQHMAVYTSDNFNSNSNGTIDSISDITRTKIKLSSAALSGETYAIDNVRLWWVPVEVNTIVNLSACTADGVEEEAYVTLSGVESSVANIIAEVSAQYDFAGQIITGLSYTKGGELIDEDTILTADTTLYAEFGYPNILVAYSSEFTDADDLNAVPLNPATGFPSPKYENGYLSYEFTNGAYNPHFQIPGLGQMSDDVEIPVGVVESYEFRLRFREFPTQATTFTVGETSRTFDPNSRFQVNGTYITNNQYTSWTDNCVVRKTLDSFPYDEWFTVSYTGTDIKNDTNVIDGMRFGFEFAIPAGSIIDIDYIRFIGNDSAKQADVTIDYADLNAAGFNENVETKVLAGTTSVGDLMNMIGTTVAGKTLKGLSLTENGALLSESMMIEEDVYLYCVWQSPYILKAYSSEFTNAKDLNSTITSIDSQYTGGYYTTSYNEDGYLHFEFNVGEGYCVYNPWFVVPGLGGPADDIQIGAGELDYVEVRIRYNGFVPGTYVRKIDNTSRSATASQNSPFFYYTTDTKTTWGAASYSTNMDLVANGGKWLTLTIPADKLSNNTNPLNGIRYDLPYVCNNGSSIDIDYIRFVGFAPDVEAPTSMPEEMAMRFDGEGAKYNGIRYMASVTSATNEEAVDIGWVVTSYDYWVEENGKTEEELDVNDVVAGSSKVKVAYKRANNEDLVAFFDDSDDEALVFSAVLYNIKAADYQRQFILRPFISDGTSYYYGAAMTTSMVEVATSLKNSGAYETLAPDYQAYIDEILG